jgi:hypothetical protein
LVVQVVASALQSSMHFCLSRLASDGWEETAADSGKTATKMAAIDMARAGSPNFIDFLRFAPRISPQWNL